MHTFVIPQERKENFMVCNKILLHSQFYRSAQKDRLQNENTNLNHSHSVAPP